MPTCYIADRNDVPVRPQSRPRSSAVENFPRNAAVLTFSVTHPDATVMLPRASMSVDWEVELAAVIGRPAKDVGESHALDYVTGYLPCF
jgi:2-keto-4-pentenoate hydratase/2-oxohepta-3-ene-1,7-dioic acid hydratase in catechol pathway